MGANLGRLAVYGRHISTVTLLHVHVVYASLPCVVHVGIVVRETGRAVGGGREGGREGREGGRQGGSITVEEGREETGKDFIRVEEGREGGDGREHY